MGKMKRLKMGLLKMALGRPKKRRKRNKEKSATTLYVGGIEMIHMPNKNATGDGLLEDMMIYYFFKYYLVA